MLTRRSTRGVALAAVAVASLALTACDSGTEVDAKASDGASASASSDATQGSNVRPDNPDTTEGGNVRPDNPDTTEGGNTRPDNPDTTEGGNTRPDNPDSDTCNPDTPLTFTAKAVTRPLNTFVIQATNNGKVGCNLYGYPALRFGEAQSVFPVNEDTQPQSVVYLEPGATAYAGVLASSAESSKGEEYSKFGLSLADEKGGHFDEVTVNAPGKPVFINFDVGQVSYWRDDLSAAIG